MRAEDKRVGVEHDIDHIEQQKRLDRAHESELLLETGDDRAEENGARDQRKVDHYQRTLGVLGAIFHGELRALDRLDGFTIEEVKALLFLEEAVRGRHRVRTHLVYAEDRKDLLEQALAVLYPTMAHGLEPEVDALREEHDALVDKVTELRDHLGQLEEAQDVDRQIAEGKAETKGGDEGDDDADDDAKPEDADDAKPPSSLWTDPEEQPAYEFEVVLLDPGTRMIEMVREVRDALGIGIREAMQLVEQEQGPRVVHQTVGIDEAEALKRRLEASGGTVEIRSLTAAKPTGPRS